MDIRKSYAKSDRYAAQRNTTSLILVPFGTGPEASPRILTLNQWLSGETLSGATRHELGAPQAIDQLRYFVGIPQGQTTFNRPWGQRYSQAGRCCSSSFRSTASR